LERFRSLYASRASQSVAFCVGLVGLIQPISIRDTIAAGFQFLQLVCSAVCISFFFGGFCSVLFCPVCYASWWKCGGQESRESPLVWRTGWLGYFGGSGGDHPTQQLTPGNGRGSYLWNGGAVLSLLLLGDQRSTYSGRTVLGLSCLLLVDARYGTTRHLCKTHFAWGTAIPRLPQYRWMALSLVHSI
jgi:hypothetical protein